MLQIEAAPSRNEELLGVCFAFYKCLFQNAIQKDKLFPFGLSEGDSVLQDGDDEVSEALKTKKPLQFYNVQFNILYVSHCFHYI